MMRCSEFTGNECKQNNTLRLIVRVWAQRLLAHGVGGYTSAFQVKRIRQTIREWWMASIRNNRCLEDLAGFTNPVVLGWMNYHHSPP
jgi:hypothetical protein